MNRATKVLKPIHDEAMRAHPMRWVVGLLLIGYAIYRVEKHGSHVADESARVEHIITATAFLFGAYYIPYGREAVRGLAAILPFGRKQDPNSTLGGGGGR